MKKQDLIVIVVLFALMLAWPMVYTRFFQPNPAPGKPAAAIDAAVAPALTDQTPVKPQAMPEEQKKVPPAALAAISNETAPTAPAGKLPLKEAPPEPPRPEQRRNEQRLSLTNANMVLVFSSLGGGLVSAELPKYRRTVNKRSGPVILDFSNTPALTYTGFPELSAADDFTLQRDDETGSASPRNGASGHLASGADVALRAEKTTSAGVHFTRLISFGADYQIIVKDTCRNEGRQTVTLPECAIQMGSMRQGAQETKTSGVEAMGIDVLYSSGGEGVKYWAGDLPKLFKQQADEDKRVPRAVTFQTNSPADWVAVKSKFFALILVPEGGATGYRLTAERALAPGEAQDPGKAPKSAEIQGVAAMAFIPARTINPGESTTQILKLYAGPKKYSLLRKLGLHQDEVMDFGVKWDYGVFELCCVALLTVLNAIYTVAPNYGVAIILLTILIRILFWPLTHKSTESMKKMQELQPQIAELRKKYKESPRKLQEETMALYKQNKVNPVSGCLPMLIQIPVFIALFVVLRSAIELRFADFLWIQDLSEPERLFANILPIPLNILPIFMAVTQAWQQSLMPATDPAQQKMLLFFMPVMMLVMFYMMPSALVLYWSANQVIMIVQQLIQKKRAALKKMRNVK